MIAKQQTYLSNGDVLGVTQAELAMRRLFRAINLRADRMYLQQPKRTLLLCRADVKQVLGWSPEKFGDNTVFEDDAIERIAKLIGCNFNEADMWRRAFAKRTKRKLWSSSPQRWDLTLKEEIVEDLRGLSGFGICRALLENLGRLIC